MIKPINKADLSLCLHIFHRGYETVALEFGLTEENCPYRGRASLPYEVLEKDYEAGELMFGYYVDNKIVGFLGIKIQDEICKLNDLIILPEYRQKGYGNALLDFCKRKASELGALKLRLGMINDNLRLKNWYIANGFINIGYKRFDKAPFTVGYMECLL